MLVPADMVGALTLFLDCNTRHAMVHCIGSMSSDTLAHAVSVGTTNARLVLKGLQAHWALMCIVSLHVCKPVVYMTVLSKAVCPTAAALDLWQSVCCNKGYQVVAKQMCMLQVSIKRDIAAQVDHLAKCHCDVRSQVCCLHVSLSSHVSLLPATGHSACAKIVPVAESC